MLEDMLRGCVMEFPGSWDRNIPLMEFVYNNSYQASCSDPRAWPYPVGGFEPKPGDARPKPLIKSIYQINFINISVFILKSLRKRFQFGVSL